MEEADLDSMKSSPVWVTRCITHPSLLQRWTLDIHVQRRRPLPLPFRLLLHTADGLATGLQVSDLHVSQPAVHTVAG